MAHSAWPELPVAQWADTRDTLQLWTQIVGKVRMVNTPLVNHWWNVPLYVSARGLTTGLIPQGTEASRSTSTSSTTCSRSPRPTASAGRCRCEPRWSPTSTARSWLRSTTSGVHRHLADAGGDRRRDPVRPTTSHVAYDADAGAPVLAGAGADQAGVRVFRAGSSARSARCTSSGVRSTSRSPGSPAGRPRHIPAVCPTAART